MLWQSLDFWTWQNVTRDSEPWERAPAMSARFLEAICSFDQVVPEIGKKKSPCPMMVSDTGADPCEPGSPDASDLWVWWGWWGPISPSQLRLWVMLMIRSHSGPRLESSWPLAIIADGRKMRDARLFWLVPGVVGLYPLGGNRSEKININTSYWEIARDEKGSDNGI